MKARFIPGLTLVSFLVLLGACSSSGGGGTTETITTYDVNSRIIGTVKANPENPLDVLPELRENILTAPLTTYHLSTKGDVPYVEANQLVSALNEVLKTLVIKGMSAEVKDNLLYIKSQDKYGEIIINAATDEVKVKNTQSFVVDVMTNNNNIPGDYYTFKGNAVKDSDKTKVYKPDGSSINEYEVYSFKDYGFDIVEKENKFYVPFEALTKLIYRDVGIDFAYNGKEFYINNAGNFLKTLINSSNGYFQNYLGVFSPTEKGAGEAYRFFYPYEILKEGSETETERATKFLILNENGTGSFIAVKGDTLDYSKQIPSPDSVYSYSWTKEGNMLYVRIVDGETPLGDYQIHLDETRFLKGSSSKEVSEYNYNILRFLFDTVYGLRQIKGYSSAESYFSSLGINNDLKSTDISTYNKAVAKLIGNVDDGHSNYVGLSPLTKYEETDGLPKLVKDAVGERVKKLNADQVKYAKARINKYKELHPDDPNAGNTDPNFYQGLRFSSNKETAVITFDGFTHNKGVIENMKELFPTEQSYSEEDYLIRSRFTFVNSSPDGFSTCFDMLRYLNKNSKVVKNVVIDLTNNGGGMIATLPYLEAFFSDDPTYALKDTNNGTIREYHYKVDLNGDGVFGGEGDTFKGKFNFYFLTSAFSFSCGNFLPGFAKDNGIKIIGERSGGGTSAVGVFLDGIGSAINISNRFDMLYKDANGNYVHNDAGIPLDYEFPLKDGNWYDQNAIQTFIKSIEN